MYVSFWAYTNSFLCLWCYHISLLHPLRFLIILFSPISGNSTSLLHSAGAIGLVRWHMDCHHAVLLSNNNLTFLSMKGDGFWNPNKYIILNMGCGTWLQEYLVAAFCLIIKQLRYLIISDLSTETKHTFSSSSFWNYKPGRTNMSRQSLPLVLRTLWLKATGYLIFSESIYILSMC